MYFLLLQFLFCPSNLILTKSTHHVINAFLQYLLTLMIALLPHMKYVYISHSTICLTKRSCSPSRSKESSVANNYIMSTMFAYGLDVLTLRTLNITPSNDVLYAKSEAGCYDLYNRLFPISWSVITFIIHIYPIIHIHIYSLSNCL